VTFSKAKVRVLINFGLVGLAGFIVDASILILSAPFLGLYWGRVFSFFIAATVTWLLNRNFTFVQPSTASVESLKIVREYFSYLVLMLWGAGVNYLAYVIVLRNLTSTVAPLLGIAIGSAAGMMVNFFSARRILVRGNRSRG